MTKLLLSMLVILPIIANSETISQPLVNGFYSDSDKTNSDMMKGDYLVHVLSDRVESSITILSATSREKYFSDGYGINEQGGVLINPITLSYVSPQTYQASVGTCIITMTQKSDISFKLKTSSDNECFTSSNAFQATGTITSKMINNDFYFTNNESGIKLLHGI